MVPAKAKEHLHLPSEYMHKYLSPRPRVLLEESFRKNYVHKYLAPPWPKISIEIQFRENHLYGIGHLPYVSYGGIRFCMRKRILTIIKKWRHPSSELTRPKNALSISITMASIFAHPLSRLPQRYNSYHVM